MIHVRTATVHDPLARANVLATLAGPGGPAGVTACSADGAAISVSFDAAHTAPELIDALIAIAAAFVPARGAKFAGSESVALAAAGLAEPALDATRIIETYLP